jgi:hypothetical protein
MPTRPPIVPSSGNWPSLLNDESGGPDEGLIQGVKIGDRLTSSQSEEEGVSDVSPLAPRVLS